jgi:hypothetical protein
MRTSVKFVKFKLPLSQVIGVASEQADPRFRETPTLSVGSVLLRISPVRFVRPADARNPVTSNTRDL